MSHWANHPILRGAPPSPFTPDPTQHRSATQAGGESPDAADGKGDPWPHLGDVWRGSVRPRAHHLLSIEARLVPDRLEHLLCAEPGALGGEAAAGTTPPDAEQRRVHPGQKPLGVQRGTWKPSWKRRHVAEGIRSGKSVEGMGSVQCAGGAEASIGSPRLSGSGPQLTESSLSCHCTPRAPEARPTVSVLPSTQP